MIIMGMLDETAYQARMIILIMVVVVFLVRESNKNIIDGGIIYVVKQRESEYCNLL
jgi:hypothetical protein